MNDFQERPIRYGANQVTGRDVSSAPTFTNQSGFARDLERRLHSKYRREQGADRLQLLGTELLHYISYPLNDMEIDLQVQEA